ncbi:MAG: hypothetical protein DMF06_12265, partial [Verrucomicrobia bacterium]
KTQTAKTEPAASQDSTKAKVAKTEPAKASSLKEPAVSKESEKTQTAKTEPAASKDSTKAKVAKTEPAKASSLKEPAVSKESEKTQTAKTEPAASQDSAKAKVAKTEPAKPSSLKEPPVSKESEKTQTAKTEPAASQDSTKAKVAKTEPAKPSSLKEPPVSKESEKAKTAKADTAKAPPTKEPGTKQQSEKVQTAKADPVPLPVIAEAPARLSLEKNQFSKLEPGKQTSAEDPVNVQLSNGSMETASTKLADGFDFPVGKPDAEGYYKARGYRPGGHQGEDWDGVRGGDTDLRDPIYCIGDGIVVFARDVHRGWGNVVIVRHAYREGGTVKHIDSLYGHLNSILVRRGQRIARGQQLGTMGTAHGQYDAHLHLEIRKNLEIGMSRSKFQKNFSNYYDPTQFIASHRQLAGGGANFRVAMNTFTHDAAYHFDDARDFSARRRSTTESSAALKRAVSSTTR